MLSSLRFGSFLSYSPHGSTPPERTSVGIRYRIKQDGYLDLPGGAQVGALAYAVRRLRRDAPPRLLDLLGPDVVLVPVPGSAPLPPRRARPLWIARRLCEELLAAGFGARCEPLLARIRAVAKSSTASRERLPRPDLATHYLSLAVARRRGGAGAPGSAGARLTLVDDFVTRGTTLLAAASRLAEAFPDAEVRAFALVRTQFAADDPAGRQRFRAIVDPVYSSITLSPRGAWRRDP